MESAREDMQDPPVVRTKGCGASGSKGSQTHKKAQTCSKCGAWGHNKRSCSTNCPTAHPTSVTDAECVNVDVTEAGERAYDFNAQLVSHERIG